MWPGSPCPPTSSAGTCGWPVTTCSWSPAPTSTARRSCLADKRGVSARELVDVNHRIIAAELADLGCSYDLYTRTTTPNHYAVAQELFGGPRQRVHDRADHPGAISPTTGRTLPDRYIEGTCPICGYGEARGDQCDNCGNQLDPTDLIDPRSKIDGEVPAFIETSTSSSTCPRWPRRSGSGSTAERPSGLWRPNVIKFSRNILDEVKPAR